MTHLTSTINGQLIGTFNYSYSDLLNSPASIDDIIILAWGTTALIVGTNRYDWGVKLKERAQQLPDESFKLLIDQVRVESGRDPATSTTPLIIDVVLQKYYVLTPKGSKTDSQGTIVNKIRSVTILPLQDDQVTLLENQGYDIEPIGLWNSIQDFANGFPDPIALQSAPNIIINGQPVTIFLDGSASIFNVGNFGLDLAQPQVCPPLCGSEGEERIFLPIRNPTDINGTEISIPIADNIINNLGGSPNDGTPSGQETTPSSKEINPILPLGILFLAGGF